MTGPQRAPGQNRPHVLFIAAGIVVFVAGIGLAAHGVADLVGVFRSVPSPLQGSGPLAIADGTALVSWGCIVLTEGRYLWRAARRRGWRDRLGRVLTIVGYLMLGYGIDQALHVGVHLWGADSPAEGQRVALEFAITFGAYGLLAVLFVLPGLKLANEKILLKASAGVDL